MARNDIHLTISGNLTGDPELRSTANGVPVANFTVASNPRVYDRQASEWRDGTTTFMKCTAWRAMAENIAESLRKGDSVVVTGNMVTREFETRDGERRSAHELEVADVGASLARATMAITRNRRDGGGQAPQRDNQSQAGADPWAGVGGNNSSDPWANSSSGSDSSDPWAGV